jgi:hypothetical protein
MGNMERLRILINVLAVTLLATVCAPLKTQAVREIPASAPATERVVPEVRRPMPFSPDAEATGRADSIEFRTVEQMSEKDRELAADAESSIGEHAGYVGLEFNEGKWSYQQVVCPALPNHIFLRFLRNNGTGDVSVFTASIPLGDEGRVRIIPIQLRGYSLFSPAPINALTISAFNHIRAEEHPDKPPEWFGTGLCYAALAGGDPQASLSNEIPEGQKYFTPSTPILEIPARGGAVILFADVSANPRPMEWTMTFDGKGRLLRAKHTPAEMLNIKTVNPAAVDVQGKPAQETAPTEVPQPQAVVEGSPAGPEKQAAPPIPQADVEMSTMHPNLQAEVATMHGLIPLWDPKKQAVHPIPLWDPATQAVHPIPLTNRAN